MEKLTFSNKILYEETIANCDLHGEYIAIVYPDWFGNGKHITPCASCEEQAKIKNSRKDEQERRIYSIQKELKELAGGCLELTAFHNCTFENFICEGNNQYAMNVKLQQVQNFVKLFDHNRNNKTVGLWFGRPGSGKTHLAFAIINELVKRKMHCAYIKLETLRLLINEAGAKGEYAVLKKYVEPQFLVIDEINALGDEKMSRMMSTLAQVIDERYMRAKPTLLIGNGIPSNLSEPIKSRISENKFCLDFNSLADYRKNNLQNKNECDIVTPCAELQTET